MEIVTREQAGQKLELIRDSFIRFNRSTKSDSFRARDFGALELRQASDGLEHTIGALSYDLNILFTVGDNPMYGSVFRKNAYDFLDEDYRKLGSSDELGPRESLAFIHTHWVSNILTQSRGGLTLVMAG